MEQWIARQDALNQGQARSFHIMVLAIFHDDPLGGEQVQPTASLIFC